MKQLALEDAMPNQPQGPDGKFLKGRHYSLKTEFKRGQHWRKPQIFRDAEWLRVEYVDKKRSSGEIAEQFGVTEAAIIFWLRKHGIPRRSMSEVRAVKQWALSGEKNGMYGRRGELATSWKGGVTPERQAFHGSVEWKAATSVVWARDRGECRVCLNPVERAKGAYAIHHVVSFSYAPLRAVVDNLVLLCYKCHRWVHSRKNTDRVFIREAP